MIILALHQLWKKYTETAFKSPQDTFRFATFVVENRELADQIRCWMRQDAKSKAAIKDYLDELVPLYYRVARLSYACDNDGRLEHISFTGVVPHGWGAVSQTSTLLKPVSAEAIAAVDALPKSSRQELHDLIGWPTVQEEWAPEQQIFQVRQANRMVRPEQKNGRVLIHAPHPDNFKESCPVVAQTLNGWTLPSTMRKAQPQAPQP